MFSLIFGCSNAIKVSIKEKWYFDSNASNASNAPIKATPTQIQKYLNENVFHFSLLNEQTYALFLACKPNNVTYVR